MNTDKLVKAIQIIVEEEVTRRVPKLVREGVKKEMAKLLKENKQLREVLIPKQEVQTPSMAQAIFEDELPTQQTQKQLSKNPVLNEVLSQTVGFNSSTSQGGLESMRAQMASQMGYGDLVQGAQPTGIGIDTGNEIVNKALNRDYSQLMKALDKKKGPYRPGM
jgi:hypothetical protein